MRGCSNESPSGKDQDARYFAKNILIASATSQPGLADVVLEEYAHASVHGAVLTKVDEAVNLGPGLSTLVQKAVPLLIAAMVKVYLISKSRT